MRQCGGPTCRSDPGRSGPRHGSRLWLGPASGAPDRPSVSRSPATACVSDARRGVHRSRPWPGPASCAPDRPSAWPSPANGPATACVNDALELKGGHSQPRPPRRHGASTRQGTPDNMSRPVLRNSSRVWSIRAAHKPVAVPSPASPGHGGPGCNPVPPCRGPTRTRFRRLADQPRWMPGRPASVTNTPRSSRGAPGRVT